MIRAVFRTALRALRGFLKSLITILGLELTRPHYLVFCRRAKGLRIPLVTLGKKAKKEYCLSLAYRTCYI